MTPGAGGPRPGRVRGAAGRLLPALVPALLLAAVGAAGAAVPAAGQQGDTVPEDTVPRDTVPADTTPGEAPPADTVPGDTLRPDTLPDDSLPPAAAPADTAGRGARMEEMREGLTGGGFPQRDSVFRQLAETSGYRAVEYRGKSVSLDVPSRVIQLRDSAQANYTDAVLRADSITYRSRLQFMSAHGDIRLLSPDQRRMTTDSVLYYDVSRLKGTVLSARTSFSARGADWQVQGDAIPVGDRTLYVNRGTFTSCERDAPHYYFRAGKIKMVSQDVIVAWPVTLYIADVPVFWLPFFAQDIRPERRSGVLPPQFGVTDIITTSSGMERSVRNVGYYWAIDRFMDASFTVDWLSQSYTRFNGRFRYNFRKKFIDGDVSVSRDWAATGNNITVDAQHDQQLSPDTRVQANIHYVQEEQLLRDRSVDTETQLQTIDSDVGLSHDFGFGNLELSARRSQFPAPNEGVDLTLPDARVSLSPVTLFEAPRSRAGPFNNLTFSPGSFSFSRQEQNRNRGDDVLTTSARLGPSLRLGDLSLSTAANFNREETVPFRTVVDPAADDTAFVELDPRLQSTVNWSASSDYQLDLMGSTTLSPSVEVAGAWFRSRTPRDTLPGDTIPADTLPDTDGRFVQAPTRFNMGARLTTDLFGLFPGFGPFTSVRHKVSPRLQWRYSPAVRPSDPALGDVPGFPGGRGETEHTLSVTFNQTIEAKMPVGDGGDDDGEEGGGEGADGERDEAAQAADGERRTRTVTLLSVRSDALRFDFNRPGPTLVTDRFSNSIGSDLFRGLNLTVEHDLFEGSGEDRTFSPFLSRLNASFSVRSGQGLGGLLGLGGGAGGGGARPVGGPGQTGAATPGLGGDGEHEAGPWTLSLNYNLQRSRQDGGFGAASGETVQTVGGNLRLQPTPNWSMRWSTQYNFTTGEFGSHDVTLTRNLHRWQAQFSFSQAANGNLYFRFYVTLTDAPELRVDYDQRTGLTP